MERRQGLGIGELRDKLVAQARSLRDRIGRELGRVKAWVAERFPDPLQQIKERTRDLFNGMGGKRPRAPTSRTEREREAKSSSAELLPRTSPALENAPSRSSAGDKKRGMFDGLRLRADRSAAPEERRVSRSERPSVAQESSRSPARDQT